MNLQRDWWLWFVVIPAFAALNWIAFGWQAALAISVGMALAFKLGRTL